MLRFDFRDLFATDGIDGIGVYVQRTDDGRWLFPDGNWGVIPDHGAAPCCAAVDRWGKWSLVEQFAAMGDRNERWSKMGRDDLLRTLQQCMDSQARSLSESKNLVDGLDRVAKMQAKDTLELRVLAGEFNRRIEALENAERTGCPSGFFAVNGGVEPDTPTCGTCRRWSMEAEDTDGPLRPCLATLMKRYDIKRPWQAECESFAKSLLLGSPPNSPPPACWTRRIQDENTRLMDLLGDVQVALEAALPIIDAYDSSGQTKRIVHRALRRINSPCAPRD